MDATLMNGASCTPGVGVVFDGDNDYVDLGDVEIGGAMSVAMWVRWDALKNYYTPVMDFGDGWYDDNIWLGSWYAWYDDSLHMYVLADDDRDNGEEKWITSTAGAITLGAWTHVVGTMQGAHMVLYQDGLGRGERRRCPRAQMDDARE